MKKTTIKKCKHNFVYSPENNFADKDRSKVIGVSGWLETDFCKYCGMSKSIYLKQEEEKLFKKREKLFPMSREERIKLIKVLAHLLNINIENDICDDYYNDYD